MPGGPSADALLASLCELEELSDQRDKPIIYASLVHAAKTDDPKHGALLARTREQRTVINKHLIFFDLEWVKVPDETARALVGPTGAVRYRHYLEQKRAWRPHFLSEPEEKILEEKNVTGRSAFVRLFDETVATLRFPYRAGRPQRIAVAPADQRHAVRCRPRLRQAAAEGLTRGLQRQRPVVDLCDQHARPRSSLRVRSAPLRRSDGSAPSGERDPRKRRRCPDDRRRAPSPYRPARLSSQGPIAGTRSALRLRPLRPAVLRHARVRLADGAEHRPGELRGIQPAAGAIIREFFDKSWIDAELRARQTRRRFQQQHRAQRSPLYPHEFHRQAARRDDAGPRAGPRFASISLARRRLLAMRYAVDYRGDGQRLRRDAHFPASARTLPRSAHPSWRCCAAKSRTASPRCFGKSC